jgi:hypothetical protein
MPSLSHIPGHPGSLGQCVQRYRLHLLAAVAVGLVCLNLLAPAPPPPSQQLVQIAQRSAALAPSGAALPTSTTPPTPPTFTPVSSPAQQGRPALEPALRDPFAAPAPLVVAKVAPALPPPPIATPVAPSAPAHGLAFAGRITTPDGREQVYVSSGDISMPIATGQTLPNGYRVEAITERTVELSYPPLNTTARLELPAPPQYEIR